MTRAEFNAFCQGLPATSHVVQWGNADVWKVGGKVFAVCGWVDGDRPGFTFKVTPLAYEVLSDAPGIRPAPYLASRDMKSVQVHDLPGLNDDELRDHVRLSYALVSKNISRRKRQELGIPDPDV